MSCVNLCKQGNCPDCDIEPPEDPFFESETEKRRKAVEMNGLAWKFWLAWARIRRAAWRVLWRLGFDDVPF